MIHLALADVRLKKWFTAQTAKGRMWPSVTLDIILAFIHASDLFFIEKYLLASGGKGKMEERI